MASDERAIELLDRAFEMLDSGDVSRTARQCLRLALHRSDYLLRAQVEMQLTDFALMKQTKETAASLPRLAEARRDLISLLGPDEALSAYSGEYFEWERSRSLELGGEHKINGWPLPTLEEQIRTMGALYDEQITLGMTPIDTGLAHFEREKSRATLITPLMQNRVVLGQVKDLIEKRLIDAEAEVRRGDLGASVFELAREAIVRDLAEISPEALRKLDSAEEALRRGDTESLAQALASCRRAIKALADAVYPARDGEVIGVDDRSRAMTNDAYLNRLVQYVGEQLGGHAADKVVKSIVADTSKRLQNLNSLASKGVHDEVTISDARLCVTELYLVFGDVVRIHTGAYRPE